MKHINVCFYSTTNGLFQHYYWVFNLKDWIPPIKITFRVLLNQIIDNF